MKSKAQEIIEDLEHLYEMSNIRPASTGLPMVVWIQPDMGRSKHGPRIKVQTSHGSKADPENMAAVGFSRDGKIVNFGGLTSSDFSLVSKFITLNLQGLLNLWDDEIDPAAFLKDMKKV